MLPRPSLAARRAEHPAPEVDDESGLVGEADELVRSDHAEPRMPPAHQRLGSGDALRLHVDQWLEQQEQFLALDRVPQRVFEAQVVAVVVDRSGDVAAHARGSQLLRREHRLLGAMEQAVRVAAVVRIDADADRRGEEDFLAREFEGPREDSRDRFADPQRGVGAVDPVEEQRELVLPEAGDHRLARVGIDQPLRDHLEQSVARGIAERVVDPHEAVEVEREQRGAIASGMRFRQRLLDELGQQRAVGQAGQCVVIGEMNEILLDVLLGSPCA